MRASPACLLLALSFTTLTTTDIRAQACGSPGAVCAHDRAVPSAVNLPDLEDGRNLSARRESSWSARLLTSLGGAAVGAGLGFFASQLVSGDWDDRNFDRSTWVLAGGSVGLVLGVSLPVPAGRGRGTPHPISDARRVTIRADELRESQIRNAFEAVQLLRPHWLVVRGQHTIRSSRSDGIRAYVDGVHIGNAAALADIRTETISAIRFLDAAAATLRWGAGHLDGAIEVVSVEHRER